MSIRTLSLLDTDADTDSNSGANSFAWVSDAYTNAHANPNSYANANTDTHADSFAWLRYAYTYAHPDAYTYANADSYTDAITIANQDHLDNGRPGFSEQARQHHGAPEFQDNKPGHCNLDWIERYRAGRIQRKFQRLAGTRGNLI
jgi:hypothetical protein